MEAHAPTVNTLRSRGLGAQLCISCHELAYALEEPQFYGGFGSLAHVCSPAATKDNDSDLSEAAPDSSENSRDMSMEDYEAEEGSDNEDQAGFDEDDSMLHSSGGHTDDGS